MHVSLYEEENEWYSNLLAINSYNVAETKYPYLYWTENHLQAMWWEQKYFKNLKTSDQLPITVISPGIWNHEAGPVFLKAHLKIGDQELKGDIEVHLEGESWANLQHDSDNRYKEVILHVCLWPPLSAAPTQLKNAKGEKVYQTYLAPYLTISQTRILQLIDIEQYPYRKFLGNNPSCFSPSSSFVEEKIFNLLPSSVSWGLAQKVQYLKGHMEDARLLLPTGIAMALGGKQNAEAFFELFIRLLKYKDKTENELLSIALGMSGFFAEKYKLKWKDSLFYQELLQIYTQFSTLIPHSIRLLLNQIRPLNHPIRGIAYLVKLIQDPLMPSLFTEIYACWHQGWPEAYLKKDWKLLLNRIKDRLPSYSDEYWRHHYTFESQKQALPIPLLKKSWKDRVILNTVLPLLSSEIIQKNNPSEIKAFHNFYSFLNRVKDDET
ncbi:DUF2851 family protein [Neochlamydia sp. S13]|uniref:DUF2851 family protein n=1 Tax=Neochlamydia sp. S13 TaxID=1353976 RepID=UPI0005A9155B|nr:DUF2851 family protein [Neochlamydia sp. S13]BBI18130.1 Uncharacterized protein NCS13_1_1935 [Neochlamydia sp. S13]